MYVLRRLVALALSCSLITDHVHAHSRSRSPLHYLSLIEDANIHTPSHRVHALSSFDLTFYLHRKQQRIKAQLEPNHDILHEDATVEYIDAQGEVARVERIDRLDHRVFKGHTWIEEPDGGWTQTGWARIVIRRDGIRPLFEGAFTIGHNNHHVQMRSNYMATKHELDPHAEESEDEYMVVFRDSDLTRETEEHSELRRSLGSDLSCQADQLSFNLRADHPIYSNMLRKDAGIWGAMSTASLFGKRQIDIGTPSNGGNSAGVNLRSSIGSTAGCPNTRKVALVGVATDCTYTASFNSTDSVRQNIIIQMNSASDAYEKAFNITLGLRNLTINDGNCPGTVQAATPWNTPCANNVTIEDRLNTFSQWRGSRNDSNSHWTLLTRCNTGSRVGLAWLGQVCVAQTQNAPGTGGTNEFVSGANVVARTQTEWQVIAHETGHIFGAVHDCTAETCNDGRTVNAQQCCPLSANGCDAGERFIMNPATGVGISAFSPCSIGNICSAIGRNSVKSDCLSANRGVTTITGNQCGNGIVEEGEDCDCGGEASCGNNSCCDARTCKFKSGAVCDDANEDCCRNCQFASSQQVCRASTGECDPEERCTGNGPVCPQDQSKPDGTRCGNNTLTCASGHCTSRDLQCKTLMGSYTSNNDTYACDSSNCQLSCASPEFGPNVCYGMQQNFLDGTECGGGGKCANGQCHGSNPVREIGTWISRHKALVIGIASVLGLLLLISLLCCLSGCIRRRRHKRPAAHLPQSHRGGVGRKHHTTRHAPPPGGSTTSPMMMGTISNSHNNSGGGGYGSRGGPSVAGGGTAPYWTGPLPPPVPPRNAHHPHPRSNSNASYPRSPPASTVTTVRYA